MSARIAVIRYISVLIIVCSAVSIIMNIAMITGF